MTASPDDRTDQVADSASSSEKKTPARKTPAKKAPARRAPSRSAAEKAAPTAEVVAEPVARPAGSEAPAKPSAAAAARAAAAKNSARTGTAGKAATAKGAAASKSAARTSSTAKTSAAKTATARASKATASGAVPKTAAAKSAAEKSAAAKTAARTTAARTAAARSAAAKKAAETRAANAAAAKAAAEAAEAERKAAEAADAERRAADDELAAAVADAPAQPEAAPEVVVESLSEEAVAVEPTLEREPALEPEPAVALEPEPAVAPEPTADAEPEPAVEAPEDEVTQTTDVQAPAVDAPAETADAPVETVDAVSEPEEESTSPQERAAGEPTIEPGTEAIRIRGLVKNFGDHTAVNGIDLTVPAGSFYGIVGPNGAGKTTTLSIVAGLLRSDGGEVVICGIDQAAKPLAAKRMMGVLPDRLRTFDRLTGRQLLYYYGLLRGLASDVIEKRVGDLARAFDLGDALGRVVSDYSAGMTKKIMLAGAMIHSPRVLVLDEPFEAVDPVSSAVILDILRAYVAHGGTVILSSHGMDLVERVCSRVAIIVGGDVLAEGTIDEVRAGQTLEARFVELSGGIGEVEGLEWLHTFSD